MPMRQAVRAIIVKDNNLLVMKRNKFGKVYYTLPGGGIDPGETAEQALQREIYEEASIQFSNPRLVYIEEAGDPYGIQYVYVCDYGSGEPALQPDSEEAKINKLGQNLHEPIWLPLDTLADTALRTDELKGRLLKHLKEGFPEQAETYSSRVV